MGWPEFFEDVIEKCPMPVMEEFHHIQCNVHPDQHGNWVWHMSMIRSASDDFALQQGGGLRDILEKFVGEGLVSVYEGGVIKRLIHAVRRLTAEERNKLPENVENMIVKQERPETSN
jgi:hypothetical protein